MFDGVSEEDDPDAALRALLARQLDCVASMMVGGDDGPRRVRRSGPSSRSSGDLYPFG
jgi:hypothetical protein